MSFDCNSSINLHLFSVNLKRSDSLFVYSFYISYVKPLLPELEKGNSGTVLGDNFSHVSLQDVPYKCGALVVVVGFCFSQNSNFLFLSVVDILTVNSTSAITTVMLLYTYKHSVKA